MGDDKTQVVINSARAWAVGDTTYEALPRLAGYWYGDIPETVELSVVRCRGFDGMGRTATRSWPEADEILSVTRYEIPGEVFERFRDRANEMDILVEETLYHEDTVETEEDLEE